MFLKEYFEKANFEKSQQTAKNSMQIVNPHYPLCLLQDDQLMKGDRNKSTSSDLNSPGTPDVVIIEPYDKMIQDRNKAVV